MKGTWWKESVVYQIYPMSFCDSNGDGMGDLKGIASKLDYLAELGVDVIWISPIYPSPGADNGYDVSDYRHIAEQFGTMEDFDHLLASAHEKGLKIMLDLVLNHSSDEHPWFLNEETKKDYYIWRKGRENGSPPSNWGAAFGGSAWTYDEGMDAYYLHLFDTKQPDLNWEHAGLRHELYDMMRFWLDKGVDGFRLDVINFIAKDPAFPDAWNGHAGHFFMNRAESHTYLQEMNREVLSQYDVMTVGEMPGVTVEEGALYTAEERNELNMVFHFEHVDMGNGASGKWSPGPWHLPDLKRIFSKWQQGLGENGWNSLYWSNHDQPRALSRWVDAPDEYREKAGKMLATCLHMMKGTPYIYQGEEIGMINVPFHDISSYRDIETLNAYRDLVTTGAMSHDVFMQAARKRSRDNARTPMQWDGTPHAGFTSGTPWIEVNPRYTTINAEESIRRENSLFHTYRQLIALRKTNRIIPYGTYEPVEEEHEHVFAYLRKGEGEELLVLCNFSQDPQPVRLPSSWVGRFPSVLISNDERASGPLPDVLELRPFESIVYKRTGEKEWSE